MQWIKGLIKTNSFVYDMYYYIFSGTLRLVSFFVKKDNQILFVSYGGRKFDDSPRVIFEYLIDDDCVSPLSSFNMVWAFEEPDNFNEIKNKVSINSFKYFMTAIKSKYWITNSSIQRGLNFKSKDNIYINYQHGTLGIKRIGSDLEAKNSSFRIKRPELFDVMFIQGKKEIDWLRSSLMLPKTNIKLTGLPRNLDLYDYNNSKKIAMRKKLSIPAHKKVILYAPTYREASVGKNRQSNYENPFNLNLLARQLGDEYAIIMTNHYATANIDEVANDGFVFNFFNYHTLNDLIIASDILVTDYSSIVFDYYITGKPVFCFAYDYEHFLENRGEPYIKFSELFYDSCLLSQDVLVSKILKMDNNKYRDFSLEKKSQFIQVNPGCIEDSLLIIEKFVS